MLVQLKRSCILEKLHLHNKIVFFGDKKFFVTYFSIIKGSRRKNNTAIHACCHALWTVSTPVSNCNMYVRNVFRNTVNFWSRLNESNRMSRIVLIAVNTYRIGNRCANKKLGNSRNRSGMTVTLLTRRTVRQ